MERKYAQFILYGLLFGIVAGIILGQNGFGLALGVLGGVFLGWFVAAIQMRRDAERTPKSH